MIERKFVAEKIKEFRIQEYVRNSLRNAGLSHIKIQKTPLGEKIIIHTSRPGLVVGKKGQNIKQLTKVLKKEFELENPQIEIAEVEKVSLNASIMAEKISGALERFGTKNFKGVGHKIMAEVMGAGALGIEIILSGKIPGSRAKCWRFYSGYLRKCGDVALEQIDKAQAFARLKSGIVGIKVSIMPPDIKLPDVITILEEKEEVKEPSSDSEKPPKGDSEKEETSQKDEKKKTEKKETKKRKKKKEEKESKEEKVKEKKDEGKGTKVNE